MCRQKGLYFQGRLERECIVKIWEGIQRYLSGKGFMSVAIIYVCNAFWGEINTSTALPELIGN